MIALLRIGSLFDKMQAKLIKGNLNTIWKTAFFYKCLLYMYTSTHALNALFS